MSSPHTFADARRIVRDHLLNSWTEADGRLWVADYGFENDTHWRVIAGSHEVLVEKDPEAIELASTPPATYLVSKQTGEIEVVPLTPDNVERLSFLTPYGDVPPEERV